MVNTLPEDLGAVVVVLHGVLHKAEAVDVADVGVAVGSEQVEPADGLLQERSSSDAGRLAQVRRR